MSFAEFDARERRNWSGLSECYGQSYGRVCAGAVPYLTESARVRTGLRVLDVGTGPGTLAAAATSLGAEVSAVDADSGMVAVAANLVSGVKLQVAALPELPFDDAQFDAVLENFVINHVGQPLSALAEMRRVAARGGHVAITIWPQPPSPGVALLTRAIRDCGANRRAIKLAPQEEFPRTQGGLRELVHAAGLRNATCKSIDWEFVVQQAGWWDVASGVSWMREFRAHHSARLLDRVRRITALLATGQA